MGTGVLWKAWAMTYLAWLAVQPLNVEAGEPLGPPSLALAQTYTEGMDPTGWWVSEKLDGVRGYWTGKSLVSRSGNPIDAPPWFVEGFPDFPLDGELWLGPGRFHETSGIVRKTGGGDSWKEMRYGVFDAPDDHLGFEARLEKARRWFHAHPSPHVLIIVQERCQGRKDLRRRLAETEARGGEGLMLRRPGSACTPGRSFDLLKVKSFQDAEARVIEHLGGSGKYLGKMGSIRVEMANGVRFAIGTGFSDKDRENPPPIGSTVTFRYKELNPSGIPRFASFMRIRDDL